MFEMLCSILKWFVYGEFVILVFVFIVVMCSVFMNGCSVKYLISMYMIIVVMI